MCYVRVQSSCLYLWDAPDEEWKAATLELFNANIIQIAQKEGTGTIYEVWIT